ncbi:pentatricopeptide repeat domain-containing protein 3 [Porites harrisoni]
MAAMCNRCARKLYHVRTPLYPSVRLLCTAPSKSPSFEVSEEQSIGTSYAKNRDPLAVLKALASTVKPAPNLPNPEFIEDMFLLPRSKAKQEACLMAKQSGREAAAFVISRCPEMFPLREPNPMWITEDLVKKVTDVKTEKDLKGFIKVHDARNAILSYECLKEQGVEVSLNTQNQLLDLAANQLGNIPVELVLKPNTEEIKFDEKMQGGDPEEDNIESVDDVTGSDPDLIQQENTGKASSEMLASKTVTPEWRNDNYAMQMFQSMTTKNATTYETMILGFIKYRCYRDAYDLFIEMRDHGHQASLFTYNLLFKAISRSNYIDSKWEKAQGLVKSMGEEPVVLPNLKTYNALMKVAVVSANEEISATELAFGLIRDMMAAGLEPSMETYNQLLRAEYIKYWETKKRKRLNDEPRMRMMISPEVLNKVITHLESLPQLPPLQDPEDAFFFRTAMSAALLCVDVKLAIRIYNLAEKQNNPAYLSEKQAPFYSAFLLTLTTAEADFNLLYDYYKEIVPDKFRPKEHIYTSLFNLASRTNNPGVVKRFYEDMRTHRVQLTTTVATALFRALGGTTDPEHIPSNLSTMLDVLRWMKMYRLEITHVIIAQLIRMYCKNDQLDEAWKALDMFKSTKIPVPIYSALNDILLKAMNDGDQDRVVQVFELMAKYGYNLNRKRRLTIYDVCKLPTSERKRIDIMFSDLSVLDERRRQHYSSKQEEQTQEFDLFN